MVTFQPRSVTGLKSTLNRKIRDLITAMYQIIQEVSHESVIFMTAAKSSTQMNTMHNVYLRRSVNAETG